MTFSNTSLSENIIEKKSPLEIRYDIPDGQIIVSEGLEYKCYELEEYKKLAHLIVEYNNILEFAIDLERYNASLLIEIDLWKQKQKLWEEESNVQQNHIDMLSTMFDDEHNLRLKLQKQNRVFQWVPWAFVVVESVLLGGLGVYSSVSK